MLCWRSNSKYEGQHVLICSAWWRERHAPLVQHDEESDMRHLFSMMKGATCDTCTSFNKRLIILTNHTTLLHFQIGGQRQLQWLSETLKTEWETFLTKQLVCDLQYGSWLLRKKSTPRCSQARAHGDVTCSWVRADKIRHSLSPDCSWVLSNWTVHLRWPCSQASNLGFWAWERRCIKDCLGESGDMLLKNFRLFLMQSER